MAKLFIGLPVYNGEGFLKESIESIRKQSFTDWEMVISDNCSTDKTEEICHFFESIDNRIRYKKQKRNLGAEANFKWVLDQARSEFFMWAAFDDIRHPDFIKSCLNLLEKDKSCGMAFSNIENIDSFGRVVRTYPDFSKFTGKSHILNLVKFLLYPEIMGKANLIYSIFRVELCRNAWNKIDFQLWGSDVSLVLSVLSRTKLKIEPKVLFQKRYVRTTDSLEKIQSIKITPLWSYYFTLKETTTPLWSYCFSLKEAIEYMINNIKAVRGTKYHFLTIFLQYYRIFKLLSALPILILKIFYFVLGFLKKIKEHITYNITYVIRHLN